MSNNIKKIIDFIVPSIRHDLKHSGLLQLNDFCLKVVAPERLNDPDWLACYRSNSIYSSRPIFWVRSDFYNVVAKDIRKINRQYGNSGRRSVECDVVDELYRTITHEVIHAILDLRSIYPVLYKFVKLGAEEDFCEDMAESIRCGVFKDELCYGTVQKCLKDFYN